MESANTQRIISNTIILYGRMLVTMLISLLTSRILLGALGIDDYGLYNAIGGFVALFGFLMSSMASATQRFLSFELGTGNAQALKDVFSMSLTIHLFIAVVVFVLAESFGLWFLNNHLQIPEGREFAANIVYQCVVLSLCSNIIIVPYSACVISHEKMSIYASISIIDVFLKLIIAYLLTISSIDKLCLYGSLLLVITVIELLLYNTICVHRFAETKYRFFFNRKLFLELFGFSGWTVLGQAGVVGSSQGAAVLINMFHSVVANASLGLANQVNGALNGLVSNFQMAYQPQITKSYACGDTDYLNRLIVSASKISFFLLFIVALPIVFNIDLLLSIWLTEVPPLTNVFCVLFIIASLFNSIGGPLWMSVFASGRIKYYQITVFAIYSIALIITYILFKKDLGPTTAVIVNACAALILFIARIFFAKWNLSVFSVRLFAQRVLLPIVSSTTLTLGIGYLLFFRCMPDSPLIDTFLLIVASIVSALFIGLSKSERTNTYMLVRNRINL